MGEKGGDNVQNYDVLVNDGAEKEGVVQRVGHDRGYVLKGGKIRFTNLATEGGPSVDMSVAFQ